MIHQHLIHGGILIEELFHAFHQRMCCSLKQGGIDVLDLFFCPHSEKEQGDCRKPKTGLIEAALKKYPQIDLSQGCVAGDNLCDG